MLRLALLCAGCFQVGLFVFMPVGAVLLVAGAIRYAVLARRR